MAQPLPERNRIGTFESTPIPRPRDTPERPPYVLMRCEFLDGFLLVIEREAVPPKHAFLKLSEFSLFNKSFCVFYDPNNTDSSNVAGVSLTPRELQIAAAIASGRLNKEIAFELRISPYTVSSYVKRIFCKLSCRNRAEMTQKFVRYLLSK